MTDFQEPGTNTGSVFEAKFPKLGPSKIVKNTRIGKASDFWNLYEKDIQLAADLGTSMTVSSLSREGSMPCARACVIFQEADTKFRQLSNQLQSTLGYAGQSPGCAGCNTFRLSIEWSRLFPQRGQLCQEAVNRYNEIFDCLERRGHSSSPAAMHLVHALMTQTAAYDGTLLM